MTQIMNETLSLMLPLVAGISLGTLFFGGLFWTVRKLGSARQPALWFLGSLLLRMCITLTGFYLVSAGQWQRLMVCLLGFTFARFLVARLTRALHENQACTTQWVNHAP
jgi:F1F0 ATPase subunit 2